MAPLSGRFEMSSFADRVSRIILAVASPTPKSMGMIPQVIGCEQFIQAFKGLGGESGTLIEYFNSGQVILAKGAYDNLTIFGSVFQVHCQ